jgi:hypothetical protein
LYTRIVFSNEGPFCINFAWVKENRKITVNTITKKL